METRSLKFVAEACAAELRRGSGETSIQRVCTDSRQAQADDLFFAFGGEHFDGHDFLDEVAAKGVAAVVVEQKKIPAQLPDVLSWWWIMRARHSAAWPRRIGGNSTCR